MLFWARCCKKFGFPLKIRSRLIPPGASFLIDPDEIFYAAVTTGFNIFREVTGREFTSLAMVL